MTLIRLTCGPTSNFTIHANIALPALSSISLISFTTFNNNSESTRIYTQTVAEWGVNESLYQSTELPCCLNGARDLKSIIFSHRTSACYFPHRCIQLRTFIHTPGTDTGNKVETEAWKVIEIPWWGIVPNCASHKQAPWGETFLNFRSFSLNLWSPTTDSFPRVSR